MRRACRLGAAVLAAALLAACSSSSTSNKPSGSGGAGPAGGTYTLWDPYPQFDNSSDWVKAIDGCGTSAGVTIKRTGYDTTDLTNKVLLAAQQGKAPNVLVVDNPVVSTLAEGGVLNTTEDLKIDTGQVDDNILAAGQLNGKTYGVPIGANTLALYYNKKVLRAAGVDIASVKDWASLTAALAKVTAAGKKGITFSAVGTEEGTFQFLPWFWGSGANLTDLSSAAAVSALSLWKDWLAKKYAPNDALNNNQTTSWQEFATGNYAFSENGTWQLANAQKAGFPYGIINIPAKTGGSAAVPTGGEFVTVPVQSGKSKDATSAKIVVCLTSAENAIKTDTALSYVSALDSVQTQQVAQNSALKPWVDAVHSAKGRTSDNLGTKYPKISEPLWNAIQAALSGSASPQSALGEAQGKASGS